ncbi:MAG: hypothetical protein IJX39_04935 [Clostridia bacterium]|nr:hypothetical protein [Clostridia bacterium]
MFGQVKKHDDFDENEDMKLSPQGKELLRRALLQVSLAEGKALEEATASMVLPPMSRKFKIRTNRLYREWVGTQSILYPEVDSRFERIRSKIRVKLHLVH